MAAAALAAASLVIGAGCSRREVHAARGTPVIVISVDTLRADRLPAYGYREVATPALDALARDAILFENAYTHVPLTLASHATLFTGRLPFDNGVRDNFGYTLGSGQETVAGFLAERGYATGGAVSAAVLARSTGISRGFAFWDDEVESGARAERDGAAAASSLGRWIQSHRKQPFFAFLHLFEPHAPYEAPEPHRSRWKDAYDAEVARSDEVLGGFLEDLRRWEVYDRALLFFLSDHGEGLGDHGEREHGIFLYREAIRVPLLLKLPRSEHAGKRVIAPVALTDVFPTIVLALGLDSPDKLAGIPLQRFLSGTAPPSRRIYGETFFPRLRLGWSDLACLVDERWHYIEAPRPELYDMKADPGEKQDRAASLSPEFRSLRLELARLPRRFEQPLDSDPEHAKKLASLGYLTARSPAASQAALPDPKDRIGSLGSVDFQKLLEEKRDQELIEAVRSFVAKNPAALDHWRMLADALERRGDTGRAIAAIEEGLRASSQTAPHSSRNPALEQLVFLLVRAGRPARALEVAAAVSFESPEALNAVGIAYAETGRLDEARASFERALALDAFHPMANLNLGTALMRAGDISGARARLEQAVRGNAASAAAWKTLGNARAQLGDESAAMEAWGRAVALDPAQYDALFNLAIAQGRRGDVRSARRGLERFVATAPPSLHEKDLSQARQILRSLGS
jgi:arylsulfatase A-like enzyme/Flp pilus assembly protein TadD